MNLTPLIDVVFVILIMFIVVAPLLEIDRVELASGVPLEAESVLPASEKSPIAIHVLADNAITLNGAPIALSNLEPMLRVAKAKYPEAHPQLFHDKNATFGTYQSVKNAVEGAGFREMDVILKPS